MTEQVDIAVVGAGPAGLQAALVAAQAGAQVTLIDSYPRPGGQYFKQPSVAMGRNRRSDRQRQGEALWRKVMDAGVRFLADTVVWGVFDDLLVGAYGPTAPPWMQAKVVILATGAYDRPVAFPGWTLPGVITVGAAQTLLKSQGIVPGRRIVLAGTGPLQLIVAADLVRAGAEVLTVLEGTRLVRRGWRHVGALWGQQSRLVEGLRSQLVLRRHRVPYRSGWGVVKARGHDALTEVVVAQLDDAWRPIVGTEKVLACDTLCLAYGFIPSTELSRLAGAAHDWRPELGGEVPVRDERMQTTVPGLYAVGDGAGIGGAPLAMVEGEIAGLAAADRVGCLDAYEARRRIESLEPAVRRERRFQQMYGALFTPASGLYEWAHDDTIICRCEEVTQAEVREVLARGADSSNEVKAVTRCGMGVCQGRMCAHLVAHLVAREMGRPMSEVSLFQPRPPVYPVPVESFAYAK